MNSVAAAEGSIGRDRRRWLAMPFIALGVAMIIVDATIVNVAVPTIIRDLHTTAASAEWINTIYSLVFAALLITLGRVGDMFGRRRLFLVGTVVFVAASIVAATAPSSGMLIFGRFLQGIGGAMILPATLSIVNTLFRGRERAIAFAIWGSTIGGMAAVGPFLGGAADDGPVLALGVPHQRPARRRDPVGLLTVVPETSDPSTPRGFDLPGQVTLIVGLGALVFGLIEGQSLRLVELRRGAWSCWAGRRERISPVPIAFALVGLSLVRVPADRAGAAAGRPARGRRPAAVLDRQLQPRQRRGADRRPRRVRPAVRAAALPAGRARPRARWTPAPP